MLAALSGWMLYTMWVILGLIGLDVLAGLYRSLESNAWSTDSLTGYLGHILHLVLPLLLVGALTGIDETGWLMMVLYYIGGVGVVLKLLVAIKKKLW